MKRATRALRPWARPTLCIKKAPPHLTKNAQQGCEGAGVPLRCQKGGVAQQRSVSFHNPHDAPLLGTARLHGCKRSVNRARVPFFQRVRGAFLLGRGGARHSAALTAMRTGLHPVESSGNIAQCLQSGCYNGPAHVLW